MKDDKSPVIHDLNECLMSFLAIASFSMDSVFKLLETLLAVENAVGFYQLDKSMVSCSHLCEAENSCRGLSAFPVF